MIECEIRTSSRQKQIVEKNVNVVIHGIYSVVYTKEWCWHRGTSSKNEASLDPEKSLISPDKKMEMNFAPTKAIASITSCSEFQSAYLLGMISIICMSLGNSSS